MKKSTILKASSLAFALSISSTALADDFTVDGFGFNILSANELTVKLVSVGESITGDVVIPAEVSFDGKTYKVTIIDTYGFALEGITSVVVPNTVTSLDCAFPSMPNLTSVTLSENLVNIGDFVLQNCPKLESVVIPNSVETIGDYVLSKCSGLKNVKIGTGVKSIGERVFWSDEALEVINLPASVEKIKLPLGCECPALTAINVDEGNQSFGSYDGILCNKDITTVYSVPCAKETVILPNTIKKIDEDSFNRSVSLKSVTLSNALESIGGWAFLNCVNLKSISPLPNTLKSIGAFAFAYCENLNCDIEIPAATDELSIAMFAGTTSLTSLSVNADNESFASKDGVIYNKNFTDVISAAGGITEVNLPESVMFLEDRAFNNCVYLKEIKFPDNVVEIGDICFADCSNLETVEFGKKVKAIGEYCFDYCYNISKVVCKRSKPAEVGSGAFRRNLYSDATLYIPKGSLEAYTNGNADPWDRFEKIVEVDFNGVQLIVDTKSAEAQDFYSIDGRKVNADAKGVVIVRYSDGSVKRILKK